MAEKSRYNDGNRPEKKTVKLLILSNNTDRASFRQRIAVYLDTLRASGIDCRIEQLPPWILSRRRLFMQAKDFDAVFLHKKILNPFDAYYLKKYAKKIIYDFDDAIMFDDKHPQRPHQKRQTSFRRTAALADLVIAGNFYLAEYARRFNPNVEILPTGLDTKAYKTTTKKTGDGKIRLVWIGSRPTLPHLKHISPALEEIGSRFDNVILKIISDEFFDLRIIPVEKRPWFLETEVTELAKSDIGLSPLADNNFTRGKCGFKILQYQAAGLPVVASPVGVNAELVRDGLNGYHATTVLDWVEKLSALIKDTSLRTKMGQAAAQTVSSFDLDAIGPQLVALITKVITASK
ncbi:MAG: glycosyltransferase family 4 protein [Sedimentisphaerales bacterium]|jgi:glycosyltransferase involved in cell wall biosynthesis